MATKSMLISFPLDYRRFELPVLGRSVLRFPLTLFLYPGRFGLQRSVSGVRRRRRDGG